jgi:non-specific protein-tyrosine kinase
MLKDREEFELRDYLGVIRRRKVTIFLALSIVVGAALLSAFLQTPTYEGKAELLIQPRNAETLFDPSTGVRNDPVRAVQTEIQILKSQPVRDAVAKKLNRDPAPASVSQVGQTDVIEVRVRSTDPRAASVLANSYADAYVNLRLTQAVNDVVAAVEQIQTKVTELGQQSAELDRRIATLSGAQRAAQEPNIRAQQEALLQQQTAFKQKLDQLQVEKSLKSGGAQIVTRASVPQSPVEPRPVRTGVLAAGLGLLFGTGLAFLFEYLDDSIKSKEDVDRILPDSPVLGLVPAVPTWRERDKPQVVSISDPGSAAAEAYRGLRTSVQFMALDRPMRTLQVTSPNAGEGKTTTLSNLAIALARAGQRVIVVCCDLRRPRVHEFFWLTNKVGFTSVLLGEVALSSAIQSVPGEDRVKLLASGPAPPNPSELLGGRRTVELLTALQSESDIVLIDSPPVLPVTDAAVLSSRVDATLMVATAGGTTQKELHRAYELLKQVDAPLIGTVLNGVSQDASYGYAYQYKHYTTEPQQRARPQRQTRQQRRPKPDQPARRV